MIRLGCSNGAVAVPHSLHLDLSGNVVGAFILLPSDRLQKFHRSFGKFVLMPLAHFTRRLSYCRALSCLCVSWLALLHRTGLLQTFSLGLWLDISCFRHSHAQGQAFHFIVLVFSLTVLLCDCVVPKISDLCGHLGFLTCYLLLSQFCILYLRLWPILN